MYRLLLYRGNQKKGGEEFFAFWFWVEGECDFEGKGFDFVWVQWTNEEKESEWGSEGKMSRQSNCMRLGRALRVIVAPYLRFYQLLLVDSF